MQIIFDGFNEYNFYIDVCGSQYAATKNGLDLVEQEMPASISFLVPDQYHKRIIGIGGQHIQRIMKRYSVFVKFSNAMDRGGVGKEEDDIKVDNVICRTPARNAQSLDQVKQEIMDMVEKVVSGEPAYPEEEEDNQAYLKAQAEAEAGVKTETQLKAEPEVEAAVDAEVEVEFKAEPTSSPYEPA